MSFSLILKRVQGSTIRRMMAFAAKDAVLARKPKLLILCDMVWCALRYGAAAYDYHTLRFCVRGAKERKSFVTMGVNVKLVKACNRLEYRPLFEDKVKFNTAFEPYLKRKWCDLRAMDGAGFANWCVGLDVIFAKKNFSTCGRDVVRYVLSEFDDLAGLFELLVREGFDLAEEGVVQHRAMAAIYSGAVNTLRLATMLKDGEAHLVYGFLRCATSGYVDNLNAGGLCAVIDEASGVITTDAVTKELEACENHPVSGFHFKGSQLPQWQAAVEMVKQAALVCTQVRYVAWDVALTEDRGPLLIEANYHPGYDILQVADQIGKKERLLRYI